MKTHNAAPIRCEFCDCVLPVDSQGHPRYKLIHEWSNRHTPLSLRACVGCHTRRQQPAAREVAGLPLFATV